MENKPLWLLFSLVVFVLSGCLSNAVRTVSFDDIGNYAEYTILTNDNSIIVRSQSYWKDSYSVITKYKVEKCPKDGCYYLTYYLNQTFDKTDSEIGSNADGYTEATVRIPDFDENYSVCYRDQSGSYPLKRGDKKSWEKYWAKFLKDLMKNEAFKYGDFEKMSPHDP